MSCSTPRTVVSTTRERGINAGRVDLDVHLRGRRQAVSGFVSTVSPARRATFTAPALLASLPFFFVMHDCCRAVLNSCDTVSCRKVSLFSSVVCISSRAIASNSFISVTLETCQCAKHCVFDFGDFGVLHGIHQCDLGASRVALRLGCCVLLTEGCDQRGILQHLLSALLLLLTVVAGAAASDCVADCLWAELAGWFRGRGPELLLRYHVRVAHLPVVDWARELRRPPTASPHPCGSPSRQDDGETRAPELHTLDDVLRFRWDEEYRAVLLQKLKIKVSMK